MRTNGIARTSHVHNVEEFFFFLFSLSLFTIIKLQVFVRDFLRINGCIKKYLQSSICVNPNTG